MKKLSTDWTISSTNRIYLGTIDFEVETKTVEGRFLKNYGR